MQAEPARRGGVLNDGLAVRELEYPSPCGERRRKLPGGQGEGRDRLERRQREQRERRDQDAIEVARSLCRDRRGQDGDDGDARDDDAQAVGDTRCERVSTAEPNEHPVCLLHACQRVVLAPVDHELGRTAEKLDELRAQVSLGSRPSVAGHLGEPSGH